MSVSLLQPPGILANLPLYLSTVFGLDSHLDVATWYKPVDLIFFLCAGSLYCIFVSKWGDIFSTECPPEGEEHLCSFLAPNMSQKNIHFAK